MSSLERRVVAITGASSGIGEATALAVAAEGAAVSLAARRVDRIEALAERINGEGGRALAIETDITDEEQANAFIARTHEELGGLDALINNAGVMLLGPVAGAPTEQWRQMLDVNLLGLLYCTHAALPIMGSQGSGDIVNVASVAAGSRDGQRRLQHDQVGVVGFSRGAAASGAVANVRVTAIEPLADNELQGYNEHPLVVEQMKRRSSGSTRSRVAEDIARGDRLVISQPPHVSINEMLIRSTSSAR